jgi:hypothetical protein
MAGKLRFEKLVPGSSPGSPLCFVRIHKIGDTADFAGVVDAGKDTDGFGDDFAGRGTGEFVSVLNLAGSNVGAGGFESKLLIIKGGPSILDVQLRNDEEYACGLEVLVGKAICPQEFGSAHLKIDRVNAVVDDAALVGLAVAGLNRYRATL